MLRLLRSTAAFLPAVLAFFLACASANAAVTYLYYPPVVSPGYIFNFFTGSLTVTDAAVASGRLDLTLLGICHDRSGLSCLGFEGNISGFISLTVGDGIAQEVATDTDWTGRQDIHVTFNPDGTLSGLISGGGFTSAMRTMGSGFDWTGSWGSDARSCPDQNVPTNRDGCLDPGYWFTSAALPLQVPEPRSLWLFTGGLFALLLALRRINGPLTGRLTPEKPIFPPKPK
jgi:hypothetical protein